MYSDKTTTAPHLTESFLLPSLLRHYLESGNSITLWQLPNSDEKHLLICSDGVKHLDEISLENSETGFVFAPFDRKGKKLFFKSNLIITFKDGKLLTDLPEEMVRKVTIEYPDGEPVPKHLFPASVPAPVQTNEPFTSIVQRCIDGIRKGLFEKIVPSRRKSIELTASFNPLKAFNKLCKAYPNCMISLVASEETGTWVGATPELLASVDDQLNFRTVSLAGTQRYIPGMDLKSVAWTEKEIEEQALVCRYIISCFKKIRLREYDEHGPRTAIAGNVLHLKSEYTVDMTATNFPQLGSVMLQLLHPTSAVCGMPLDQALDFLKKNEGYDREFYSGYLGPINVQRESTLFVNLRCMQLDHHHAILYAGAGVTIDSIPEKEWEETELKFETLLTALR